MEGEIMAKKEQNLTPEVEETIKTDAIPMRVIPDRLNLRKAASTQADVLYILNKDEELYQLESGPEWTQVHYPKLNLTGYVMSHLVKLV